MKSFAAVSAFALVILASTWPSVAQQVDASREQAIETEVTAVIDQYSQWIQSNRPDLIAERTYLSPWVAVTPSGTFVLASVDSGREFWEGVLKPLFAAGYTRSEWLVRNVCVLSETGAVVSGHFVRYRKDGSVLGEGGGTYTLARTSDGWRIVAIVSHSPAKVLQCSK